MKSRLSSWLTSLGVLAAFIGLWWLASHFGLVSRVFLPTPEAAWNSLRDGLMQGELIRQSQETVARMLLGWLLACIGGIAVGAMIGMSPAARAWLQPMLEFMRPLPASAIMPLAISIFGLGPNMVLFVVAFGAVWPVLLATLHGFASVEPRLSEVSGALQLGQLDFVRKIGLPSAMPDILAGVRLALTVSLVVAVVGEMIASQPGLGQSILLAARSFHADDLFAGIALLGLIGLVANSLLAAAERSLLKWQRP